MKKRIAISVDDDVYEELKMVPRGFSVSDFVSFMLRGISNEIARGISGKGMMSKEEFEKWVNSDLELKRVREGIRDSWGPTVYPVVDGVKKKLGRPSKKK